MRAFVVDGDFLCQSGMNGMHRYMLEILKRMDVMISNSDNEIINKFGVQNNEIDLRVVIRKGQSLQNVNFQNIKVVELEASKFIYRALAIPKYIKQENAVFCSMTNGYVGVKNSIATIHDLIPLHPESEFSFKSKLHMKLIYNSVKRNAKRLVTGAKEAKKEISQCLKIGENKISVIGSGWEHFAEVDITGVDIQKILTADEIDNGYFYTLGSAYSYKNTKWVCENAKYNPASTYIIGGTVSQELKDNYKSQDNIKFIGRVEDEENKALVANCKAFLYPSMLEGFGIPPLEALTQKKDIVIADMPIFREIYKSEAYYVKSDDYRVNLNELLSSKEINGEQTLKEHSWEESAKLWLELMLEETR